METELQNVNFYTNKNLSSKFTPKTRKSRMIGFCDKMRKKTGVCVHTSIQNIMFLSAPNIYTNLHSIWVKCAGVWGKLTPMKWAVYTASEACM